MHVSTFRIDYLSDSISQQWVSGDMSGSFVREITGELRATSVEIDPVIAAQKVATEIEATSRNTQTSSMN